MNGKTEEKRKYDSVLEDGCGKSLRDTRNLICLCTDSKRKTENPIVS
jgi:hypothetical protein